MIDNDLPINQNGLQVSATKSKKNEFKTLLIQNKAKNFSITKEIEKKLKLPPIYFAELSAIDKKHDQINTICLLENKGAFLQLCPSTNKYLCCNYRIINTGANCSFGCSYCILQDYLKTKMHLINVNLDNELRSFSKDLPLKTKKHLRIGNGEFTDSLIIDHLTGFSSKIINFFKKYPHIIFEFKTKSINIDNLLQIPAEPNIVVAWSLNTPFVTQELEAETPTLEQRLEAAKKIADKGYNLAFHFDPMVDYDNAHHDYAAVIDKLYEYIPKAQIRWISMGALRFTKGLAKTAKKSPLFINEFIEGDDHKLRYLRPKRVSLFQNLLQAIQKKSADQFTYLCMESPAVWEQVYGFTPKDNDDFERWFNSKVF